MVTPNPTGVTTGTINVSNVSTTEKFNLFYHVHRQQIENRTQQQQTDQQHQKAHATIFDQAWYSARRVITAAWTGIAPACTRPSEMEQERQALRLAPGIAPVLHLPVPGFPMMILTPPQRTAGPTRSPTLITPIPAPTQATLTAWQQRATIWTHCYTERYTKTIYRFLGLAQVGSDASYTTMLSLAVANGWKTTTRAVYWAAVMAGKAVLGIAPTTIDKRATAFFEHAAKCAVVDYPTPMSEMDFHVILHELQTQTRQTLPIHVAVVVCYVLGQRISDILQLAPTDLRWQQMGTTRVLAITIYRGKVISSIGPYSLFLPEGFIAQALWNLAVARHAQGQRFIWTSANTQIERERAGNLVRNLLHSVNPDLEQRSIRRGGLEHMANAGWDTEIIRALFSKHSSEHMLMRYLANGRVCMAAAKVASAVTWWAAGAAYPGQTARALCSPTL